VTQSIGGSLSLGAATFASVLLASRLPSPGHVAALMLFTLQVFVAWPFLRRDLARGSRAAHALLALAAHGAVLGGLGRVNGLLAGVHGTALLCITFVCPYALVRWSHNLKRRINGCVAAALRVAWCVAADVAARVLLVRTQAVGRGTAAAEAAQRMKRQAHATPEQRASARTHLATSSSLGAFVIAPPSGLVVACRAPVPGGAAAAACSGRARRAAAAPEHPAAVGRSRAR
jgi:hypothetical protein